jgi:hypothetical protein
MKMKVIGAVNILIAGGVSALMHGGAAIIFGPILSAIFLGGRLGPLQGDPVITENTMIMVVLSPFAWAILGFIIGGTMALFYNLFKAALHKEKPQPESASASYAAGQQAA